jgi:hypothetical protein
VGRPLDFSRCMRRGNLSRLPAEAVFPARQECRRRTDRSICIIRDLARIPRISVGRDYHGGWCPLWSTCAMAKQPPSRYGGARMVGHCWDLPLGLGPHTRRVAKVRSLYCMGFIRPSAFRLRARAAPATGPGPLYRKRRRPWRTIQLDHAARIRRSDPRAERYRCPG